MDNYKRKKYKLIPVAGNDKTHLQGDMIIALQKYKGIVTSACKTVGIKRQTHYDWIKKYPEYAEAVKEVQDQTLDYVESKLFNLIRDENPSAIMFYLRTKGRSAGYGESLNHTGEINLTWNETKTYDSEAADEG